MKRTFSIAVAGLLVVLAAPVHAPRALADDPPAFMGASRQFTLVTPVKRAAFGQLVDRNGKPVDLSAHKGKVLLVNFWATWCAPCIIEMPTLDALKGAMDGPDFAVLTISLDRKGMEVVDPFWREKGYKHLTIMLDPQWRTFRAFGGVGLPTTYLVDHKGDLVGYLQGHADWNSEEAKALIRWYIARARRESK